MARNYRATVAYDGTAYSGFQIQVDQPTIQGELERVLVRLNQEFVRVHGAGRTDAGVHARGQVITCSLEWRHPVGDLQRAMNALLPQDIAVRDVRPVAEDFHARFSARSREYRYQLYSSPVRVPTWDRYAAHLGQVLDLAPMRAATGLLVGEADFGAFGQPPQGDNTVRQVLKAGWAERPVTEEPAGTYRYEFTVEANGFLRGMVRRLVGVLTEVGLGRLSVEEFCGILRSRDISRASPPAPACGLCLYRVTYPDGAEG